MRLEDDIIIEGPNGSCIMATSSDELRALCCDLTNDGVPLPVDGSISMRAAIAFYMIAERLIEANLSWYKLCAANGRDLIYFRIPKWHGIHSANHYGPRPTAPIVLQSGVSFIQYQPRRFAITPMQKHNVAVLTPEGLVSVSTLSVESREDSPSKELFCVLRDLGLLGINPSSEDGWSIHDRSFHYFSRRSFPGNILGATLPKEGFQRPPPRKFQRVPSEEQRSRALEMLRLRSSRRDHGKDPITVDQLISFLFNVFGYQSNELGAPSFMFPAAGGIYEFEVVAYVGACNGLARGVYLYSRQSSDTSSALQQLASASPDRVLRDAAYAWGMPGVRPQVVISVLFDVSKLAEKYKGVAYRLALLNGGVLIQTMYLVAEVLFLAGCAIGGGDISELEQPAAPIAGDKVPLVEFAIGSRATT
jgi:SagB-type dehydrogenase family enzyme